MPITLLVRTADTATAASDPAPLTFDGMQRVVLGRGRGADVRLPDRSVSHRHATIESRSADFVLIDEGSTNGTYVGGVRLAPRTSRILRSGDRVKLGRVAIDVTIDRSPATKDVAAATRDLALAMMAEALLAAGDDLTTRVRVVEGPDLGAALPLADDGRAYVIGRGEQCDLLLADEDASRAHAEVTRRGATVTLRDLGSKNGVGLGGSHVPSGGTVVWRSAQMVRLAHTVLALEEPVLSALDEVERAPDEPIEEEAQPPAPTPPTVAAPASALVPSSGSASAPVASVDEISAPVHPRAKRGTGWTISDVLVMLAALAVFGLSIAGLVWLLKG